MPSARNFWSASSSRMPFLATMPITMIRPMNEERLNVVPVISSARNTPQVESSAEAQHRDGRGEIAEFEQQHDEDQHDGQHQHEHQVLERFLLLLVTGRRTARGCWAAGSARRWPAAPWPCRRPGSCLRSGAVTCDVALQVLAADFGLAGDLDSTLASEPRVAVLPVPTDQQGVADGVQRGARAARGSARGWCRSGR